MAINLIKLSNIEPKWTPGHRLCAGCPAGMVAKMTLLAAQDMGVELVVANATGCLEVCTGLYPYTNWKVPWIHNAFENAASTIAGVEAAYKALKRRGRMTTDKPVKFVAFGGDGGTYDIGLQALSGAAERWHDFVYVCYDNEAYMNTGYQRSGATPTYANTTTAPAGEVSLGKEQRRKDLTAIMAAHHIPYVAQATISHWQDFMRKVQKALSVEGPAFINVLSPCVPGWKIDMDKGVEVAKLAVETNFWPLFEVENDVWKINFKPKQRKPIEEFLKVQGRFRHILKKPEAIAKVQKQVDEYWEWLLKMEDKTQPKE